MSEVTIVVEVVRQRVVISGLSEVDLTVLVPLHSVATIAFQGMKGDQGDQGPAGPQGDPGPAGPGVAAGGTTGQLLAKASNANYDTTWVNDPVIAHEAAGDPHPQYTTAVEASAIADASSAAAVAAHEAAVDPHAQYQKESEKGNANGYASLDGSGTVPDAQIPAAIARNAEVTAAIAAHEAAGDPHPQYTTAAEASTIADAAVATHVALADPHAQYQKESEKDQPGGYAGLDGSSQIAASTIPNNAVTFARMQDIAGVSIVGKPDAGVGDPTVITSTSDNQLLVRRAGVLVWATLVAADLPAHASSHQNGGSDEVGTATPTANAIPKAQSGNTQLATGWLGSGTADINRYLRGDGAWAIFPVFSLPPNPGDTITEETVFGQAANPGGSADYSRADHTHGTPADPVPDHEAAADPHPGYQKESEKGVANGYAGLDANSRLSQAARILYDGVSGNITSAGIADGGLLARSGATLISVPAVGTYLLDIPGIVTATYLGANAVTFPKAQIALMSALSLRF